MAGERAAQTDMKKVDSTVSSKVAPSADRMAASMAALTVVITAAPKAEKKVATKAAHSALLLAAHLDIYSAA